MVQILTETFGIRSEAHPGIVDARGWRRSQIDPETPGAPGLLDHCEHLFAPAAKCRERSSLTCGRFDEQKSPEAIAGSW